MTNRVEMRNKIFCGDALSVLRTLPDCSVQMCCTSPPYYALRSYLPPEHPDKSLEIGLEETPHEYVAKLVEVFREVKTVLRNEGILWINIGDTYANDQKCGGHSSGKHCKELHTVERPHRYTGLPAKNLIGIPWRLAFALQDDGWILRSDIVWEKPNCFPESVNDRVTRSHEYVFFFTKERHYFYDADAIAELSVSDHGSGNGFKRSARLSYLDGQGAPRGSEQAWQQTATRNCRSVWTIPTEPFPGSHYAVMPTELVRRCVLAGSSPQACEHCGMPWRCRTVKTNWEPMCSCSKNTGSGKCVVLDPFCGAGTTPLVSIRHGRHYLGIEINPAYIRLAEKRIAVVQQDLWTIRGEGVST